MDETSSHGLNFFLPMNYPPMVKLNDIENVFRFVLNDMRDRQNKSIPAERAFGPNTRDNGKLSVDRESISSPEQSLARVGSTYKTGTEEFKDYSRWEIYSLHVGSIRLLDKTIDVIEDPILINPPVKGRPENPSHALVDLSNITEPDMPEIVLKLRNLAVGNKVSINMEKVEQLVTEYRNQ